MNSRPRSERMGTEPILPLLIKLSIPSVLGMLIQAFYNVVDSIYIGHVSTHALSALSLAFPIQMVLISISVGTGIGATSLISRTLGAGRKRRAANIAEHVVLISIVYGFLIAAVGYFFTGPIVRFFTSDPQLIELTGSYIRIIMLGSLALFVPMIFGGILRGEGNTFVPMLTMILGALLNIGIDPLLIFGLGPFPELGIRGAAYATVLARLVSGGFIVIMLFGKNNELALEPRHFRFTPPLVKELYRVGFPAMAMQLLASVMLAGSNLILAAFGPLAIAVFGIFFRLQSFVLMPIFGLGQGVMPLVGYNFGNARPDRLKRTVEYGTLAAFAYAAAGFALFQLLPGPLIRMFNIDPELVAIGTTALPRISIGFLFVGPTIISANLFQSVGKGMPSFMISILRTVVLLLPTMFVLGSLHGLDSLWYAFPIAELITMVFSVLFALGELKSIFRHFQAKEVTG